MHRLSAVVVLLIVSACVPEPQPMQPADAAAFVAPDARYEIVKLRSLGGTVSVGTSLNNRGWVAGFSDGSVGGPRHAVLWRDREIVDLGTLGGPNSNVQWPGLNHRGIIVGISQTSDADPLDEAWSCSAFIPDTDRTCVGFAWERGEMNPLPTLGGNNGFATSVNSRRQAVGWAETAVRDPTCVAPQVLQFRAVLWDLRKGTMQELQPFPGDSTSAATAINERGQVVGISGECDVAVGRFSARRAVLWHQGSVTDIGNLGGVSWHTPMDINEAGDVVGFSNPPGDDDGSFIAHAFIWNKNRGIRDLGLFPGDDFSQAFAINARRQVVGRSCGPNGCLAVLWRGEIMMNLNDLADLAYGDILVAARDINDAGRITGNLVEGSTGNTVAFLAIPRWK